MRDGIIESLPAVLPADKVVLLAGPEGGPGMNFLKAEICNHNRSAPWIRVEFRETTPTVRATDKLALILTLGGINGSSLTNLRAAARNNSIPCPHHALTVGEAKEVLRLLAARRSDPATKIVNGHSLHGSHNGNGTHDQEVVAESAPIISVVPVESGTSNETQSALDAIERLKTASDEAQVAVLLIVDQYKSVKAKNDDLIEQMKRKDKDYARMQEENTTLRAENARLRGAFDQFGSLLQKVKEK